MSSAKRVVILLTAASGHLNSGELGSMKGQGQSWLQQQKDASNSFTAAASGHLDGGELPRSTKGMGQSQLEQWKAVAIS
jgi:hypothetical protein